MPHWITVTLAIVAYLGVAYVATRIWVKEFTGEHGGDPQDLPPALFMGLVWPISLVLLGISHLAGKDRVQRFFGMGRK